MRLPYGVQMTITRLPKPLADGQLWSYRVQTHSEDWSGAEWTYSAARLAAEQILVRLGLSQEEMV